MSSNIYRLSDYTAPELPEFLNELPGWVIWQFVQMPGEKARKIPYYSNGKIRSGVQGSAEDRQQMTSYRLAYAACLAGGFSGIGLAIFPEFQIVALDFDNCVKGGKITVPFIAQLATTTYSEYSPSGSGIRAFFRGSLPSRKDTQPKDGSFAVEFFGDGGYVTVTGLVTEECQMFGCEMTVSDLTEDVVGLFRERFGSAALSKAAAVAEPNNDDDTDDWLLNATPTLGWTPEQSRGYLFDCDASCSRDVWLKILMALHFESDGADWALELACEWSATGENFGGRKDVEGRWRSFRRKDGGGIITGSWLLSHRAECLTKKRYASVDHWRAQIKGAKTEYDLREGIARRIAKDGGIGDIEMHTLANALQEAFKGLGAKYPINICRKMISGREVARPQKVDQGEPDWLKDWVYVTEVDRYYRIESGETLTVQGFNSAYNQFMPTNDSGNMAMTAHTFATVTSPVSIINAIRYMPVCGPTFEMNGRSCVNSYHASKVPAAPAVIDLAGGKAVEKINWHIEHVIAGGRKDVEGQLMSFLAHNVQFPGKKVRWAPLIKGVEGDGKSMLGNLMSMMMGASNVRTIGPNAVKSDFNNWAEGVCFATLEELRMVGHNRYDVANKLKPFITNDTIELHLKGRGTYDVPNTVNYMAFTNYADAIPLTEDDRRWFIIFCVELADLVEQWGGYEVYFNSLVSAINNHPLAFKRYLLDYKLYEGFNPNGKAPKTAEKAMMANMAQSDEELVIRELVGQGIAGVNENVILTHSLTKGWTTYDTDLEMPKTRALCNILMRMGYMRFDKAVKFEGRTQYLWSRKIDASDWRKFIGSPEQGEDVHLF